MPLLPAGPAVGATAGGGLLARLLRARPRAAAEARLAAFRLVEGAGGRWAVMTLWDVACAPSRVDVRRLAEDVHGQLSDGWGEGVEQFRFGPRVVCDDEENGCRPAVGRAERSRDLSTSGRYAFNLTLAASRGSGGPTWTPDTRSRSKTVPNS